MILKKPSTLIIIFVLVAAALFMLPAPAYADVADTFVTNMFGEDATTIDIVLLMTVLSLLPSILIMLTAFTRIIIVLSFVRGAIGMQNMPPNQVMIGLALFLTFFVMAPVFTQINETAYIPYSAGEMERQEFIDTAIIPIRQFMGAQIYNTDMEFFIEFAGLENISAIEEVPTHVLIPAFITSEIKRAFQIGFFIYIPFIVIDMIVASVLMSMGMMMLPPAMISLPFKVLLFVVVDGWQLAIGTLLNSFGS